MSKYLLSKYFTFSTAKKNYDGKVVAALYIFSLLIWTILRQKVGTYENNLSLNICVPPLHPGILKSWGMWLWALKPVWWTWVLKTGVCCCLLFLPSKNRHRLRKPDRNTSVFLELENINGDKELFSYSEQSDSINVQTHGSGKLYSSLCV